MDAPLQFLSAAYLAFAAAAALTASWLLRARPTSPASRAAALSLRLFWASLGLTALLQLGAHLAALAGHAGPIVAHGVALGGNALSALAMGSLVAYFAYLVTGSRRAVPAVAAAYAAASVWAAWLIVDAGPTSLRLTRWFVTLDYADPPSPQALLVPSLMFFLPTLAASLSFLVLGLRARGITRYRGVLVGSALTLWFAVGLSMSAPAAAENDLAQAALRLTGVLALTAVLVAYHPPQAFRDRWGVVPLGDERRYESRRRFVTEEARRRRERFARRAQDLV